MSDEKIGTGGVPDTPVDSGVSVAAKPDSSGRTKGNAEAAVALRRGGVSYAKIGAKLGISRQSAAELVQRHGGDLDTEEVEDYKKNKGHVFHAKQKKLMDALDAKKIEKMSGRDLLIGTGILQDKLRDMDRPSLSGFLSGQVRWVDIVAPKRDPDRKVWNTPEAEFSTYTDVTPRLAKKGDEK